MNFFLKTQKFIESVEYFSKNGEINKLSQKIFRIIKN
jgi:hypothetical protein